MKSTVDEIRVRFDAEVDRFSVLETGQSATMDAPLVLDLITAASAGVTPTAKRLLDVGCGAGNYTLKLLQRIPNLDVTLIDLSQPMLDRAHQRISSVARGTTNLIQGDIRQTELGECQFDIILAAAVLHHLRTEDQWRTTFSKFHRALSSGGSIWISDLIQHTLNHVMAYVEKEDTPRSLMFQLDLLREVGFVKVEVLHKTSVFAAFGAIKT